VTQDVIRVSSVAAAAPAALHRRLAQTSVHERDIMDSRHGS